MLIAENSILTAFFCSVQVGFAASCKLQAVSYLYAPDCRFVSSSLFDD
jgi:hypothetical protein